MSVIRHDCNELQKPTAISGRFLKLVEGHSGLFNIQVDRRALQPRLRCLSQSRHRATVRSKFVACFPSIVGTLTHRADETTFITWKPRAVRRSSQQPVPTTRFEHGSLRNGEATCKKIVREAYASRSHNSVRNTLTKLFYINFFSTSSGAAAYVLGSIEQLARPWLKLRIALE